MPSWHKMDVKWILNLNFELEKPKKYHEKVFWTIKFGQVKICLFMPSNQFIPSHQFIRSDRFILSVRWKYACQGWRLPSFFSVFSNFEKIRYCPHFVRLLSVRNATTFHDRLGPFMVRSIAYDPRIRMTKGIFFGPVLGLVGGVWSPIPFVFHIEIGSTQKSLLPRPK
jgi:hypothetical protein